MTFALCSLSVGDEYKKKVELCTKSQNDYVKKHGYVFITDESVYDTNRTPPWSKIRLIQKYLRDYDYMVWIDADVMIMNNERRIEEFISLVPDDAFLFIGRDFNNLNSGVFIIRNCAEAFQFLDEVWSKTEYLNHEWWEQAAMIDLYPKYRRHIRVLPHKYISIMNAYDYRIDPKVHWKPGDFCIHFAGVHQADILKQLQLVYSNLQSNDHEGSQRIEQYTNELACILKNYQKTAPASL